jgi:hypothetical protein
MRWLIQLFGRWVTRERRIPEDPKYYEHQHQHDVDVAARTASNALGLDESPYRSPMKR